jgi:hypothetical protein
MHGPDSAEDVMHLTDAAIGAAVDPGGGGASGATARAHAASCVDCGNAVELARTADRDVADMLRALDHPLPALDFSVIQMRAAQPDAGAAPRLMGGVMDRDDRRVWPGARVARGSVSTVVRRGAILLLAASAAAAAVAPRSPVHHLMTAWLTVHREAPSIASASLPPASAAPPRATTPRGIAIIAQRYAVVSFRLPQARGEIRVATGSAPDPRGARVSVLASADGVTYTVSPDTISIDNHAVPSLDYHVELPPLSQLRVVSIRVGGRVVFARNGVTIETTGIKLQAGTYVIPLSTEASVVPARRPGT